MSETTDAWERTQVQIVRVIALGLDALVDQGAPLKQEEYQAALEEAARRGLGLARERVSAYPEALGTAIQTILDEWRSRRIDLERQAEENPGAGR